MKELKMNKQALFPTSKTAYRIYAELENINNPIRLAEILLFHLFILKHLFNLIKIPSRYSEFHNRINDIDAYREIIARAFCFNPLHTTKEKMQVSIANALKNSRMLPVNNGFIIETFNYNYDSFFNINGAKNNIIKTKNTYNLNDEFNEFYIEPIGWVNQKISNIYNTNLKKEMIIDFAWGLTNIVQEIKNYAHKNKIKLPNIKPFTESRIRSCKNNKILEICFIFIKYYLQEKLSYKTIYDELGIPYIRNSNKKLVDTKIRKNSIFLLNTIVQDGFIYKLKEFIKTTQENSAK